MIRTLRKTNVSPVRAEILKYGKLVLENGRVHPAAEYAVTGRSEKLKPDAGLLPFKLLGGRALEPNQVDAKARARGGLFVRRVDLPGVAKDSIALMRARFRSESGEQGSGGRPYLQATTWIIPFMDWRACPAAVLARAAERLNAEPDLASQSSQERFGLQDEDLECDDFTRYTIEDFITRGEAGERGDEDALKEATNLASIIETILGTRSKGGPVSVFGSDAFDDEAAFLRAVGRALELIDGASMSLGTDDLRIASALRIGGTDVALRHLPSEGKSVAAPADWKKTAENLIPVPTARPRSRNFTHALEEPQRAQADVEYRPKSSRRVSLDEAPIPAAEQYRATGANVPHELHQQIKERITPEVRHAPVETGIFAAWRSQFIKYEAQRDDPMKAVELICATVEAYDRLAWKGHRFPEDVITGHPIVSQKNAFLLGMALCGQVEWAQRFFIREMLSYVAPTIMAYGHVHQNPQHVQKLGLIARFASESANVIVARLEELEVLCTAESNLLTKVGFFALGRIVDIERTKRPIREAAVPSPLDRLAQVQSSTYAPAYQPGGNGIIRRRQRLADQTNRPDLGPPTYQAFPDILTLDPLDRERGSMRATAS